MPRRQSPRRKRSRRSKTKRRSPKRSLRRRRYRASNVNVHEHVIRQTLTPTGSMNPNVVWTPENVLFVRDDKDSPKTYITTRRFMVDSTIVFVGYIHQKDGRYTETYFEMSPGNELFVNVGVQSEMRPMSPISIPLPLPTVTISSSDRTAWSNFYRMDEMSTQTTPEIAGFSFNPYPQGDIPRLSWRSNWSTFNGEFQASRDMFSHDTVRFVLLRNTHVTENVISGFSDSMGFDTFGLKSSPEKVATAPSAEVATSPVNVVWSSTTSSKTSPMTSLLSKIRKRSPATPAASVTV